MKLLILFAFLGLAASQLTITPEPEVTVEKGETQMVTCMLSLPLGDSRLDYEVGVSLFRLEKKQKSKWFPVNAGNDLVGLFLTNGRFHVEFTPKTNYTIIPPRTEITIRFTLSNIDATDHGDYRCSHIKGNEIVSETPEMKLFIREDPTSIELTSKTVGDGVNQTEAINDTHSMFNWDESLKVDIECSSTGGMPAPEVVFTIGGVPFNGVHTDKEDKWTPDIDENGFQTKTTVLPYKVDEYKPKSSDDGKLIECKSMNKNGTVFKRKTAIIRMAATKPSIICDQTKPAKLDQANVEIICTIMSKPRATKIWWEFPVGGEMKSLKADDPPGFGYYPRLTTESKSRSKAIFKISRVMSNDFQTYKLTAENSVGATEISIVLQKDNTGGVVGSASYVFPSVISLVLSAIFVWLKLF